MMLEGFLKEFFDWAQPLIPVSLRLTDGGQLVEAEGKLFATSGVWTLDLLASKDGKAFWFFARQETNRSVEVVGHWPADKETLASVLASLPRQAN